MTRAKSILTGALLAGALAFPMAAAFAASGDMSSSPTPQGYSAQTDQQFVQSCVKASSPDGRSFCQCLIHQLRTNVPFKRFSEMDCEYRNESVSDQTRSRMADAAKACASS